MRDSGGLTAGSVLLTAHDLHEAPWGDGRQLDRLIRDGLHGNAVLLPEPLRDVLPIAGRGSATWKAVISRDGLPVHEVMRPREEPSVIAAGAELIARLARLDQGLTDTPHPICGAASVFIGQFHSGEIYNQYPQSAWLEGTRRWLPGTDPSVVERDFRARLADLAGDTRTTITCDWITIRDAFALDPADPLAATFQDCYQATSGGTFLPTGPKPFVDDGNESFYCLGRRTGDYTRPPRRRAAHRLGVGRDRRLGPCRMAICGNRGRVLRCGRLARSVLTPSPLCGGGLGWGSIGQGRGSVAVPSLERPPTLTLPHEGRRMELKRSSIC